MSKESSHFEQDPLRKGRRRKDSGDDEEENGVPKKPGNDKFLRGLRPLDNRTNRSLEPVSRKTNEDDTFGTQEMGYESDKENVLQYGDKGNRHEIGDLLKENPQSVKKTDQSL